MKTILRWTCVLVCLCTAAIALPAHRAAAEAAILGPVAPTYGLLPWPASSPSSVGQDRVRLPILMYHHIQWLGPQASAGMQRFTVSPAALEQQVAYLTSHGYHTIYFADLVAYFDQGRPLPDKPVILTFDDAWQEQYTLAYPILRKYGVVATFFPPINWIDHSRLTLTWAEIEEMDRHGMEFGSHTVNHHLLSKQTPAQIKAQLQDSKAALEKHVTKPVVALAYPGGDFNPTVIKLATQAGYGAAVWVVAGLYQDKAHRMVMPRMGLSYQTTLNALIAWLAAAGRDAPNIGPKVAPSPQANSSHQAWEERLLARKLNDMGDD